MIGPYQDSEIDPVFKSVVAHWLTKIKSSKEHKKKVFQDAAMECLQFYTGPKSWEELMGDGAGEIIDTTFKVSVNKTFEFVTIFGPALYFENPVRTVKPRMPVVVPQQFFGPDVMTYQAIIQQENQRVMTDGLRSVLMEAYLNWTPVEFRLAPEARLAIDEALIKGRGCLWTELFSPPGTEMKVVRSVWDSTDNLLVDPDAPSFDKATWIARKCVHPVWQVERDYGLRPGSIKGNLESNAKQSDIDNDEDLQYDRKRGMTNDLLVYWQIFSKMGVGGRLQGIKKSLKDPLEMFGDYCYLVVAENCQYPLNLNPDLVNSPGFSSDSAQVFGKVAWPTPYWGNDGWPVSVLDFHSVHNSAWPMAHLKAGMGELKFLNWCMSFLMGKIRNTSRDFIAVLKEAGEELKAEILGGKDLTMLEIGGDMNGRKINDIVQFLQHPEVNGDIWKMIEAVENNFDKRVGLTELMYGNQGSTQIRSATEAQTRNQNMNVRPDDMRKCVEAWMSQVAAKEAIASRYHLIAADIQPVLGAMAGFAWTNFVSTRDVNDACRQLEYRIEAGSTKRPNREYQAQKLGDAMTTIGPVLQAYGQQTGDMNPMNALVQDWAKANDLDPNNYVMRAVAMPVQNPAEDVASGQKTGNSEVPS